MTGADTEVILVSRVLVFHFEINKLLRVAQTVC